MSLILQGSTSGSITLQEPAVAGTNTISLPAATGTTILADASNNLQMNSGYGSNATAYGCRAWVNFNGTGTVAIRASGNVSSITDNGAGDYTVNFTNAMPDTNYCTAFGRTANFSYSSNDVALYPSGTYTTSAFRMITGNPSALLDDPQITAVVFR